MELFETYNGHAFPSTHALLIEPFKSIWEKDNSEGKADAIRWFTYIELLCSPRKSNPFHGYNEDDRPPKVKKEVFKDENYEIPFDLMQAIIRYKELLHDASPSYSLYEDAMVAAEDLKKYLRNIKLEERTSSGAMVIKPADVTKALTDIPNVMKSMEAMRIKVQGEIIEDTKTRNQRKIGYFER